MGRGCGLSKRRCEPWDGVFLSGRNGRTHRISHISRRREDDGRDGAREDDRPPGPEAVHLEQHPPEVRAGQVSRAQRVPVLLAAAAVHGDDVLDEDIQGRRHHGALGRRGYAEGGSEAAHAEDVKGEVDGAEVVHDGGEGHGEEADWNLEIRVLK